MVAILVTHSLMEGMNDHQHHTHGAKLAHSMIQARPPLADTGVSSGVPKYAPICSHGRFSPLALCLLQLDVKPVDDVVPLLLVDLLVPWHLEGEIEVAVNPFVCFAGCLTQAVYECSYLLLVLDGERFRPQPL